MLESDGDIDVVNIPIFVMPAGSGALRSEVMSVGWCAIALMPCRRLKKRNKFL
jgi:hypothetical protein